LRVYEQKQAVDDSEAMDIIRGMSPVAWQHINLFCAFEFSPELSKIKIDDLVDRYADPSCWGNIFKERMNNL
jgi:hypothetical protein